MCECCVFAASSQVDLLVSGECVGREEMGSRQGCQAGGMAITVPHECACASQPGEVMYALHL